VNNELESVQGNGRGLTGAKTRHMSGDSEEDHKILRRHSQCTGRYVCPGN